MDYQYQQQQSQQQQQEQQEYQEEIPPEVVERLRSKKNLQKVQLAFSQKENKYVPLLGFSARKFLDKPGQRKSRAVTFEVTPEAPIEVDPNPVYLRAVKEDAMASKPGQPFFPSFPGATRALRKQKARESERLFLGQPPIDEQYHLQDRELQQQQQQQQPAVYSNAAPVRGVIPQPFLTNPAFNQPAGMLPTNDPFIQERSRGMTATHDASSYLPPGMTTGGTSSSSGGTGGASSMSRRPPYHKDDSAYDSGGGTFHNNARTPEEWAALQAKYESSLHHQHSVRHGNSDAVAVIRTLLYFRNIDTSARDGPHNEATSRFMQLEFLRDLQWLIKDGITVIKYPSAGNGGAPHMRHFTIWNIPWAADDKSVPMMAPFLVWTEDRKSTHAIGKAPLCNLIGVTQEINASKVLRRYVTHDGKLIQGPPVSANKRIKLPIHNAASLWFLCHVTGTNSSEAARPLDSDQAQQVQASQNAAAVANANANASSSAANSPSRRGGGGGGTLSSGTSSVGGGLSAEERAARGLAPLPGQVPIASTSSPTSPTSNNANANSNVITSGTGSKSNYDSDSGTFINELGVEEQRVEPGHLGRIGIDIAGINYAELERFIILLQGIEAINSVLVRRGPPKSILKR